jgi:hypothetical protein
LCSTSFSGEELKVTADVSMEKENNGNTPVGSLCVSTVYSRLAGIMEGEEMNG